VKGEKKKEGKEIRICRNWEKMKGIKIDLGFGTQENSLTSPCKD